MSNSDDPKKPDYLVGYKKPPEANQFKAGHPGNPRGRGKGTKNFATDFFEEGQETVTVSTGGRPARISKQRALIKKQWAAAFGGDRHASNLIISTALKLLSHMPPDEVPTLSEDDAAILERSLARYLARKTKTLNPTSIPSTALAKEH